MSDAEVALELLKMVERIDLSIRGSRESYLAAYRECLAAVLSRDKA